MIQPPNPTLRIMTIYQQFEFIVQDPFYSPTFGGMVTIDDYSFIEVDGITTATLTNEIIPQLYEEWEAYQTT